MIIEHLIVSQKSSIDFEKNTLSIFEVLEDITIQTPAADTPAGLILSFIVVVKRDKDEVGVLNSEVSIEIKKSDGKNTPFTVPVTMIEQHRRNRIRFDLQLELVAGEGHHDYEFTAVVKDRPDTFRSLTCTITRVVAPLPS